MKSSTYEFIYENQLKEGWVGGDVYEGGRGGGY